MIGVQVAAPGLVGSVEFDEFSVVAELDGGKGKMIGLEFLACGLREGGGEFDMIEGRLARSFFGIDQDEFAGSAAQGVSVPKPAVAREPVRGNSGFIHALGRARVPAAPALLRAGMGFLRRGDEWNESRQKESEPEQLF